MAYITPMDDLQQRRIKVVKPLQQSVTMPNKRDQVLHRLEMMEAELGRMVKLVNELRADVVHYTTE